MGKIEKIACESIKRDSYFDTITVDYEEEPFIEGGENDIFVT